jgi:hypothetical protein
MNHHTVEKEFRDFADDIEGVSIHYLCVPGGAEPDWDNGRITRYMPLIEPGVRRLRLKLPLQVVDPASGKPTHHYMLFHYFEIFRGGNRHYSQIYSEVVHTGAKATAAQAAAAGARPRSRRGREIR